MKTRYTERVELHCHTNKSEGYGICDPLDILKFAKQNQMPAVAFTDYGNIIAYPYVQHLTGRMYADIKPIYGIELLVADDLLPTGAVGGNVLRNGYPANYVLVLIKNEVGRRNLYRMLSEANLQAEDQDPWILWSRLQEMREGLLLGSGSSSGELACAIVRGCENSVVERIAERFDFLEVQPAENEKWRAMPKYDNQRMDQEEIKELHRRIVSLGESIHIPVVATSDAHYLREEDNLSWRILVHWSGRTLEIEDEVYFRTTEEMLRDFSHLGEEKAYEIVIQNTNEISELIDKITPVKNEKRTVRYDASDEKLRRLCEQEILIRWGQIECVPCDVSRRLEKELENIEKNGFAVTFLHYHELILQNKLKPWQYMLKEKAAASLICYLLGISHTYPLDQKNPLYIEFFAGIKGNKEPVIELVVDKAVLDEVIRSMRGLYGVGDVVRLSAFCCMSPTKIAELIDQYEKNYGHIPKEMKQKAKCDLEGCLYRNDTFYSSDYAIVPKGIDVQRYFPVGKGFVKDEKTSCFSRFCIDHQFLTYRVRGSENCTLLTKLQEWVKYYPTEEDIANPEFLAMIPLLKNAVHAENYDDVESLWTTEYEHDYLQEIISECKPVTFTDYVKVKALFHGKVWEDNGRQLLREGYYLNDVIACAEDIYEKLMDYKMDSQSAIQIAELVRKGKYFFKQSNAIEEMRKYQVPEWIVSFCENTRYLVSRADLIETAKLELRILYYKINYPKEFDEIYSELSGMKYDYATRLSEFLKDNMIRINKCGK